TFGDVRWSVTPKTHGKTYELQSFYRDNVANDRNYETRGLLKIDGVAPTIAFRNTGDTANFTSNPSNHTGSVTVRLKMSDADSGHK
ncbi:hypothetical protein DV959_13565, partial [Staphylococcus pseudintermedius]|uniref:hypothetical protein n=1 Tax=Staphylococcus pseudintermedius TaxID=283734 RepID=UPI000E3B1F4C